MGALEELLELSSSNLNSAVKVWKEEGGKIVGYWCSYIPSEIIHAGKLFPYKVKGLSAKTTSKADVYMSPFNCMWSRSILELAYEGEYDFLDGLVGSNQCDHNRRAHELWVEKIGIPFDEFIDIPNKIQGELALDWYREELRRFKNDLENYFHVLITSDALLNSINMFNKNRILLRQLHELQKEKHPVLRGSDLHKIFIAGVSTTPEEYNKLLTRLLEEIHEREPPSNYRARIMVCGWCGDDTTLRNEIEGLGALVVTDNCCFGTKDYWNLVEIDSHPLDSIAKSYLQRIPCPRMADGFSDRLNYIKMMVDEYNVDGIIFNRIQSCDFYGTDGFLLKSRENDIGVPISEPLIQEYGGGDEGRLRTRCEAFIEQIEK
ncbi:MAG: 2-hydroxyacyl-CoA dehydratase [Desulfobacteraceae bacterium]|uniref:2-hydroxyacyl-CoA dehydratase n=1 Tax=Candidatus Desulfacyla euxinica TaxID=2841693 RepID=A0A8J6T512_9DELT|nr:2-hydroxyacyl-CoA dehydratase [Candidatus Desulfacyla euxinica]MBL6977637.1 2-hydroxyacyl-CoA dehydratase [Desulfobacteraceae bacterium]